LQPFAGALSWTFERRDLHGSQLICYEDFDGAAYDEPFLDRYCADRADPLVTLIDEGLRTALIAAIEALPEREKLLRALYYDNGMVLREIRAVMGVGESRVSQLHSQAVAGMRAKLRAMA
jgi:RNA polymerase sigma factor for flagellar operon FliA